VFRVQFIGAGQKAGVTRDIYFKIFPRKTCGVPGCLIGFPTLDAAPQGLGHRVMQTVHAFEALGVCLPRLELLRRQEYAAAKKEHEDSQGQLPGTVRSVREVQLFTTAVSSQSQPLLLHPMDSAVVPANWDGKVPDEDFRLESLDEWTTGVPLVAEHGMCAGGSSTTMELVTNESLRDYTLELGTPLGRAVALQNVERAEYVREFAELNSSSVESPSLLLPLSSPELVGSNDSPPAQESWLEVARSSFPRLKLDEETLKIVQMGVRSALGYSRESSSVHVGIETKPGGKLGVSTGESSCTYPPRESFRLFLDALQQSPLSKEWWSDAYCVDATLLPQVLSSLPSSVESLYLMCVETSGQESEGSVLVYMRGGPSRREVLGPGQLCCVNKEELARLKVDKARGCFLLLSADSRVRSLEPRDALLLRDLGMRIPPARYGSFPDQLSIGISAEPNVLGERVRSLRPVYGKECPALSPEGEYELESSTDKLLWVVRARLSDEGLKSQPMSWRDMNFHLVQDREEIEKIEAEEIPPQEYYDQLRVLLGEKFPEADPELLDHSVPLVAALDTATLYAMSFGIAKFQLAQEKVKLVGEYVGRFGRSPNPEVIRSIQKWPPINCLKDLQSFLGTANYVRAHAGPAYCRITAPLRPLLKPGAVFPMTEEQSRAIENVKALLLEDHVLAVPDEAAAILAANAWLSGDPPEGRPFEMGADTSGYAIGGVTGQCVSDEGDLRVLLYFSAHLSLCQQQWHPYEQELWGLLCARRDMVKHLGRIPAIIHTDHANLTRLDTLPLERIEPKHFRWASELLQGGSRLFHRPGAGALHRAPDAISRHPEGRDRLILAKADSWTKHRLTIKGVQDTIASGEFDDEDQL